MEGGTTTPIDKHPSFTPFLLPAFIGCLCVCLILLRKSTSNRTKLPPGPWGLPFIGHLHLLGNNPHRALSHLSKIHGPLMYLRFGSVPVVVVSSPSMAKQVLQAHDLTFSSRFQPAVATLVNSCLSIAFSHFGPYWKLMRQICVTDLLGTKRLQSFQPLITEEVHALLLSILGTADEVPVREKLRAATHNIISRMAVGKRLADVMPLSHQANPSDSLVNLMLEIIRLLGVFNVGDFIPCLAWMDLQGCERKTKAITPKFRMMWQKVIDAQREMRRRSTDSARKEDCFLDVLMSVSERRPDISVTDVNIMALLMEMFGAGIDTSAITTEWALAELLANSTAMNKLRDELEHVVGMSRVVQETDIPHLPYLCAVVKETMRLHPVAPLLIPHKASQECNICGYHIPSGTLAYVNVWAMGRDPITWERPLEFRPERFLESKLDVRGQHFELLPFGSGRRSCPGLMLGLTNVQYMLASVVHSFDWSVADKLDMSEKFGITVSLKKPLVATATPRLSRHLLG